MQIILKDVFVKIIIIIAPTFVVFSPWLIPKVAIATAIASSKLFDAAVKLSVTACS